VYLQLMWQGQERDSWRLWWMTVLFLTMSPCWERASSGWPSCHKYLDLTKSTLDSTESVYLVCVKWNVLSSWSLLLTEMYWKLQQIVICDITYGQHFCHWQDNYKFLWFLFRLKCEISMLLFGITAHWKPYKSNFSEYFF
jgi:hypothetical protein